MGMDLALKEINGDGGVKGRKLEIVYEDSQSEPTKATSSLQKLITTDRVQVVIGDIASSSVLAMASIAEKAKVVLLSPGASNPDISKAGEYIFRNWQSDALEGEEDAKFAYEQLGYRKVAFLYIDNAYGTGLMNVFAKHFTELSGIVLVKESFSQGAVDMKTQLIKIKEAKPDAIYMPGYPPEMAIALKQTKELRISIPFLSTQAFDDPKILQLAGKAADGVSFSVPKPPDSTEKIVQDFMNKYKGTYNREPGVTSDTGYDAVKIIAWAIENGAQTGPQIKDQLLKVYLI